MAAKKMGTEPTNKDLYQFMKRQMDFMLEQFEKIQKQFTEMNEHIVEFKNGTYDKMDAVYKEVLAFRGEEVMHQAGQVRLQDSVDDHEKRIRKLEKPHATAHQIKK